MPPSDIEALVADACLAELEARGLRRTRTHTAERQLAEGITGFITVMVDDRMGESGRTLAAVSPVVGVRHEEAVRLAAGFMGVDPGGYSQPTFLLGNLVPGSFLPPRWLVPDPAAAADVARLLADDVVFHAYPWMQRIGSRAGLIRELESPRWRMRAAYVLAVLYMLDGHRLEEARRALMHKSLPLSHDPTTWSNAQFARFLTAFAEHFGADLAVELWPVRPRADTRTLPVKIRHRGPLAT
jgi:hypothetical protein